MSAPRVCCHCDRVVTGRCACRKPGRALRYGAQHQAERRRWTPIVATGTVWCARSVHEPDLEAHLLAADDPTWHLDHIDGQRLPSCAHHNDQYTGR